MESASVNGVRVAYDDTGGDGPADPAGPRVPHGPDHVRAPGGGVASALPGRSPGTAGDIGDTVDDGQPFTYWDLADDCLGLMDHLGIDRAVVGGMSQGGFVSLRVALAAPDRVRGLILLDTQAGTEDPEVIPALPGACWTSG